MPAAFATPAVLDYLVALADAAPALDDVWLSDGPPVGPPPGLQKVLVIGGEWAPSDAARPAATAPILPVMDYGMGEQVSVACSAFYAGGDAPSVLRAGAFAIVSALRQLIAADPKLGGLCLGDAAISLIDNVRILQGSSGGACVVDFAITATALLWDG
jgi:hypothetical protein